MCIDSFNILSCICYVRAMILLYAPFDVYARAKTIFENLVSDTKESTDALFAECQNVADVMEDALLDNADLLDTAAQWSKPISQRLDI